VFKKNENYHSKGLTHGSAGGAAFCSDPLQPMVNSCSLCLKDVSKAGFINDYLLKNVARNWVESIDSNFLILSCVYEIDDNK